MKALLLLKALSEKELHSLYYSREPDLGLLIIVFPGHYILQSEGSAAIRYVANIPLIQLKHKDSQLYISMVVDAV